MRTTHCAACAKRLRDDTRIVDHVLTTVKVCKSPICRLYGKPQGNS